MTPQPHRLSKLVRAIAGVGLVAVVVGGCGSSSGATYTTDASNPPAAQLYQRAKPALARDLPDTFACALLPGGDDGGKLLVFVTAETAVQDAEKVIDDLHGLDLTNVEIASSKQTYRDRQALVRQLRQSQPHGAVVTTKSDVDTDRCPKVLVIADKGLSADARRWVDRTQATYGDRVTVTENNVHADSAD